MPSHSTSDSVRNRPTTQRNVAICTAILMAIPVSIGFQTWAGPDAGGFLLLMLLGIGVPTGFDDYHQGFDDTWHSVAWALLASSIVAVEFVSLFLLSTGLGQSPTAASVGAFLVASATNVVYLIVRHR